MTRRLSRRRSTVLAVVLMAAVLVTGMLYSQRATIKALLTGSDVVGGDARVASLHLPPGFRVSVYATGLRAPRFFTFGSDGTLYVAERGTDSIVALSNPQHTGTVTKRVVVASGLDEPSSVVVNNGALYVGEQSRVTRFALGTDGQVMSKQVLVSSLPTGGSHITRTALFGPDGNLYVSIGSSCNDCVETDSHRAAVWVYAPDGSGGRQFASGLRNAVGMAINPWTKQIWVTNNGRDQLGDNIPPETVYALQDGGNYGWPRCHAGNIVDPDLGHPGDCNGIIAPLITMQAHSAPLGLAFYTAGQFPQKYHGLFVAFHGSWNRSAATGYKIVFIPLDEHGHIAGPAQDFMTGWLVNNNDASGRPVGLAVGPDGALYVSDDKAGLIYRVAYGG